MKHKKYAKNRHHTQLNFLLHKNECDLMLFSVTISNKILWFHMLQEIKFESKNCINKGWYWLPQKFAILDSEPSMGETSYNYSILTFQNKCIALNWSLVKKT